MGFGRGIWRSEERNLRKLKKASEGKTNILFNSTILLRTCRRFFTFGNVKYKNLSLIQLPSQSFRLFCFKIRFMNRVDIFIVAGHLMQGVVKLADCLIVIAGVEQCHTEIVESFGFSFVRIVIFRRVFFQNFQTLIP